MTKTIVINGASYEYTDDVYERLITGQEDAPAAVLRYFIKLNLDGSLQAVDELSYSFDELEDSEDRFDELYDRNVEAYNRIAELEQELAAKTKKGKKTVSEIFQEQKNDDPSPLGGGTGFSVNFE